LTTECRHKRVNQSLCLIADKKKERSFERLNLISSARRSALGCCDFGIFDFPGKRFHYRYKAPRADYYYQFIIQMQIGALHY